MRRGERKLYRELAAAATAVAESSNYAEEYVAKRRLERHLIEADAELRRWAPGEMSRERGQA
jgi:hypothetical protein